MLVRIAELSIDPGQLDAYRALLAEAIAAAVRTEPGVIFLFAVADRDDPARIRVTEGYADEAAYQAHLTAPHFLRYKQGTAAMVRSLTLTETDPVCLAAKPGALHERHA